MTRINMVDPKVLTDQHLIAEYVEIPMVLSSLRRTLASKVGYQKSKAPEYATTGKGHVYFFYDKLKYLEKRYWSVIEEAKQRGFNMSPDGRKMGIHKVDFKDFPQEFYKDWTPSNIDLKPLLERIESRVHKKWDWYRYKGKPLKKSYINLLRSGGVK